MLHDTRHRLLDHRLLLHETRGLSHGRFSRRRWESSSAPAAFRTPRVAPGSQSSTPKAKRRSCLITPGRPFGRFCGYDRGRSEGCHGPDGNRLCFLVNRAYPCLRRSPRPRRPSRTYLMKHVARGVLPRPLVVPPDISWEESDIVSPCNRARPGIKKAARQGYCSPGRGGDSSCIEFINRPSRAAFRNTPARR